MTAPTLTRALLVNGFVLGTDQYGKRIPEFCGPFTEVAKKIEAEGVTIARAVAIMKGPLGVARKHLNN